MGTPIQKLFSDRKNTNGATFVGEKGRLWYDPVNGFRVSDGHTPGGVPAVVSVSTASIGDLVITGSTISTINTNEPLNLNSNGTGTVSVSGAFNVSTPSGTLIMQVPQSGFVNFYAAGQNVSDSAFEIIGSTNGASLSPSNTGVMLQVTGNPGVSSRIYNDSEGSYPVYTGRRYNGTASSPSAVQDGEDFVRYGGAAYNGSTMPSAGNARMTYTALGTQTPSNGGSSITFFTTPVNNATSAIAPVMTLTNSVITVAADFVPSRDVAYDLGAPSSRWRTIYVGTGSVYIQDAILGTNAEITVSNGVMQINGANQLQVGQLKFFQNTIESTTGGTDIQIGLTTSTANLVFNRNVVLAAGKSFGLVDTVLGTTATMVVTNGVLTVNGANQLQVGQLKFINNTIQSTSSNINIQIGYLADTANFVVNRPLTLANSAGVTFSDGTTQTTAAIPLTTKGISLGVATLGADGKLLSTQIPTSLTGAVTFAGGWNATTNTPNLANNTSTYTTGTEFVVTVGGTQNLGGGSVYYSTGSFILYGGGVWNYSPQISNFNSITGTNHISVNSPTGAIQVTSDATSGNTPLTIVSRDASGNFTAGTISAALSGNAATATKLAATTTINGVNFDGSAPVTVITSGTGISISGTQITNTGVVSTGTLMTNAVTAGYANSFNTSTLVANAVNAQVATTATNFNTGTLVANAVTAGYANSFNTSTLVANAVTAGYATTAPYATTATVNTLIANSLTNFVYTGTVAYSQVSGDNHPTTATVIALIANSLTNAVPTVLAGYDISVTTSTGTVTVNNLFQSTSTTQASTLTVDFTGPSVIFWKPSANANRSITLTNFTAGRKVKLWITPNSAPNTFTFTGATASQFSNGSITFTLAGGGAAQASMMIELFSTTSAIGGVWAFAYGGV